jgi:hypothetical protein
MVFVRELKGMHKLEKPLYNHYQYKMVSPEKMIKGIIDNFILI